MIKFTQQQVIFQASQEYGGRVCLDSIEDAMREPTLKDAVSLILMETAMWDSSTGNPFDVELPKKAK